MNNLLKDKEFVSGLKKLMIPITLQTLMLNAVSFGDTLMLGLVSQESLAAVSLASQVSFVMSLFISTLTGGATVLSAQYIGKKDMDTVEGVLALILRGSGGMLSAASDAGIYRRSGDDRHRGGVSADRGRILSVFGLQPVLSVYAEGE